MSASIQQRVVGIITNPHREWPIIASESDTVQGIFTRYVVLLAAIGPIALFLRFLGAGMLFVALVQYLGALAVTILCAILIAWLGPRFKSSSDTVQALKMVAYATTPAWVAGVARLLPFVYGLVALIAGLYAIYIFYLGLPPVMRTPDDQRVPFMVVSAIVVIVVFTVISWSVVVLGLGTAVGLGRIY